MDPRLTQLDPSLRGNLESWRYCDEFFEISNDDLDNNQAIYAIRIIFDRDRTKSPAEQKATNILRNHYFSSDTKHALMKISLEADPSSCCFIVNKEKFMTIFLANRCCSSRTRYCNKMIEAFKAHLTDLTEPTPFLALESTDFQGSLLQKIVIKIRKIATFFFSLPFLITRYIKAAYRSFFYKEPGYKKHPLIELINKKVDEYQAETAPGGTIQEEGNLRECLAKLSQSSALVQFYCYAPYTRTTPLGEATRKRLIYSTFPTYSGEPVIAQDKYTRLYPYLEVSSDK